MFNNNIITNVYTIYPDSGQLEIDDRGYTHIPFDCRDYDDVLIDIVDPYEVISEHFDDFIHLHSGFTKNNECILISDKKPSCNITVSLQKITGMHINPEDIIY